MVVSGLRNLAKQIKDGCEDCRREWGELHTPKMGPNRDGSSRSQLPSLHRHMWRDRPSRRNERKGRKFLLDHFLHEHQSSASGIDER